MSPSSELTWLGFSDEHMVVAMDSSGLLTGLTQVHVGVLFRCATTQSSVWPFLVVFFFFFCSDFCCSRAFKSNHDVELQRIFFQTPDNKKPLMRVTW